MMKKSFWSACESIPGLSAVEAEWRQKAGRDFDSAKTFLKPRQELATCYPCARKHPCACHHQIVDHGNGNIVAVCCCDPQGCDIIPLTNADLVIYDLNTRKLCAEIGKALSLQVMETKVADLRKTTQIGFDQPTEGYSFPVYFTVQYDPDEFQRVAYMLTAMNKRPFILVVPTEAWCTPSVRSLVESNNSLLMTVSDVLIMDSGKVAANTTCKSMMDRFHAAVLPTPDEASSMMFFQTPPGSTWPDVQVSFVYGDKVSIKVKSETGTYNCTEMGMASKKNGEPTEQWKLLHSFANGHGVLDWESTDANRKNQKRKELLAKNLQAFFRIKGDPFTYDKKTKGWIANFNIIPE